MKALVLASLLFSTSAYACPNLTGSYECTETLSNGRSRSWNEVITQSKTAGKTEFNITRGNDAFKIQVPGKGTVVDDGDTVKYDYSCIKDDKLVLAHKMTVLKEDDLSLVYEYSKAEDGSLVRTDRYDFNGMKTEGTVTCTVAH